MKWLILLLLMPGLIWCGSMGEFSLTPVAGARLMKIIQRSTLMQCCAACYQDCGGVTFNQETNECKMYWGFHYPSNESTIDIMVDQRILPDIHPRNNPDGLLFTAMGLVDKTVTITDLYDITNVCQDLAPFATTLYGSSIGMFNNSYPVICGGNNGVGAYKLCVVFLPARRPTFSYKKTFHYG